MLELVDLVVERLQADPQLAGGGRLVAVVLLQDGLDVPHLDVAKGRGPLGDLEVRSADRDRCGGWALPRTGTWVGRCSGRIGPSPARIVARSITLASSRILPGQSWFCRTSIASGAIVDWLRPRREA